MKTKNKVYFGIVLFVIIGLVFTFAVPPFSQGLLKLNKKNLHVNKIIPQSDQPIISPATEIDLRCEPLTIHMFDEKHLRLGTLQNSADIFLAGIAGDGNSASFSLSDLSRPHLAFRLNEGESFQVDSSPDNGFEYEFKLIHSDPDWEFAPGTGVVAEVKNLKVCKKTEAVILNLVDALNRGDVLIYDHPMFPVWIQYVKNSRGTEITGSTEVIKQIMLNDGIEVWRDHVEPFLPVYVKVKNGDTWNLDLDLDQVNDYQIDFTRENESGNLGLEIFEL